MPDDAHLARIEERLEIFRKYIGERLEEHEDLDDHRFGDLAQTIREEFAAFEKLTRGALEAAVAIHDAKAETLRAKLEAQVAAAEAKLAIAEATNRPVRVALGVLAGAIITGLVALMFSILTTKDSVKLTPQLPPAHSSREQKER